MAGVALAVGLSSQEIQWLFQNSGYETSRSDEAESMVLV